MPASRNNRAAMALSGVDQNSFNYLRPSQVGFKHTAVDTSASGGYPIPITSETAIIARAVSQKPGRSIRWSKHTHFENSKYSKLHCNHASRCSANSGQSHPRPSFVDTRNSGIIR